MNGALLIDKAAGISSFGVIELLQKKMMESSGLRKRDLPKFGHGGTLDPFATGLLVVLVGRGVKLARYFLGSAKVYEGRIRFGETTIPGDPTDPISETSSVLPESLETLQNAAHQFTQKPYLQIPPMHSAKKIDGKPLYELARQGIEVDRQPRVCHLYQYDILNYSAPRAEFQLQCSSGTYVRTLTQDFAKSQGTVALLETLRRTSSGIFSIGDAWEVGEILSSQTPWDQLPCFIPFHQLLSGYKRAQATESEHLCLVQGKQHILPQILERVQPPKSSVTKQEDWVAIYAENNLIAVARQYDGVWGLERVFVD